MLRQYTYIICAALGVIAVSAGSDVFQKAKQKQPARTSPPAGQKKPPASPVKTNPPQVAPQKDRVINPLEPAPRISISLNLLRDAHLPEGRSLLVEAAVSAYHGRDGIKEFRLDKPSGSWSDWISIEIRDTKGKALPGLTVRPLIKTAASIQLNSERMGWLAWEVDFKAGSKLPVGTYTVVAILDPKSIGLKQRVQSPPSSLEIVGASASVSEDDARTLALSEVRINGYKGTISEGLAACEAYLAKKPTDALLLEEMGDLLMRSDKPAEALAAYNKALKNIEPLPADAVPEPPFGLLRKQQLAEERLKEQGT